MDHDYKEWRELTEDHFGNAERVEQNDTVLSGSGKYQLTVEEHTLRQRTYTRGIVLEVESGKRIADIKRNYGVFWHAWCLHHNGNEYLLCGEDYQGQSMVNLTDGRTQHYFPVEAYNGGGFCWTAAWASSDTHVLAVDGCYWGAQWEVVFFDFSNPEALPYKELLRVDGEANQNGWSENGSFVVTQELDIRASDGALYDDLLIEEQELLDSRPELMGCRRIERTVTLDEIFASRSVSKEEST